MPHWRHNKFPAGRPISALFFCWLVCPCLRLPLTREVARRSRDGGRESLRRLRFSVTASTANFSLPQSASQPAPSSEGAKEPGSCPFPRLPLTREVAWRSRDGGREGLRSLRLGTWGRFFCPVRKWDKRTVPMSLTAVPPPNVFPKKTC